MSTPKAQPEPVAASAATAAVRLPVQADVVNVTTTAHPLGELTDPRDIATDGDW